jgi:uncharacterized protein (DUF433 family)
MRGTRTASQKLDVPDRPAYPLAEAARYLRLPPATLRSWIAGRSYPKRTGKGFFAPLITLPDPDESILSFSNVVEAHVLRALRTKHGVSVRDVRKALDYAERQLNVRRLLLRPELCTSAGEMFLEQYGKLINLSSAGQLAMKKILEAYLARIEWDANEVPRRLFPIVGEPLPPDGRTIAIDPRIAFGRPVVLRRGISTATIAGRIDAGESVAEVAKDYELEPAEIEQAVIYEQAA